MENTPVSTSKEFLLDLSAMFDRYISTQEKVWEFDRKLTVGASEIFTCLRKNWFSKIGQHEHGIKTDADYEERWGAMQRGNVIEDHHVAPAFIDHLPEPLKILYAGQANQKTFVKGKNSATPDGLIVNVPKGPVRIKCNGREDILFNVGDEGCIGLEIKSIDPRANLHEERTKHHGQSQVGMGLVRDNTEYKPKYWLILYIDASFFDDMTPFLVEFDEKIYKSAIRRANTVFKAEDAMDLPAEGKYTGDCDHCQFVEACREAVFSKYKALEKDAKANEKQDMAAKAMAPLIEKFLQAKEDRVEAAFVEAELKEQVKTSLAELGHRQVVGANWKATWSTRKGNTRVDKKAMVADGVDISKYEVQGTPYDVLTVTIQDK